MAITYAATPFIRPAGVAKLPLILRNPQNDSTQLDFLKDGPSPGLKIGVLDYRLIFEAVSNTPATNTSHIGFASSTDGWNYTKGDRSLWMASNTSSWESIVVCPDCFFWNPYAGRAGEWWMYYHGGPYPGAGCVGLMTSPTAQPGTWTRYGTSPVISNGGVGTVDGHGVSDAMVVCVGPTDYRMLYRATRDSDDKPQIACATSPDGKAWTKRGVVIALNSGANDANGTMSPFVYVDELGRSHAWYVGVDASQVQRVLYAFSDSATWSTWTTNQADVICSKSATSTDPDFDSIGDFIRCTPDDGLLIFTQQNGNQSTYTGDALGRLEGRGIYWIPKKCATTPARAGRAFTTASAFQRANINASAHLLNSTVYTLWTDFRVPPGNTDRTIYGEDAGVANRTIYVAINPTGKVFLSHRGTAGASVSITSASRYDDNQWHRLLWVRRAAADFEAYVDGVSIGTIASNDGTDNSSVTISWGNWDPAVNPDQPLLGLLRQSVTIAGTALTTTQELALWNNGADGGVLPNGVTATCWVKHGSGGSAGPDTAQNGASFGTTVTGTTLVDTTPTTNGPLTSASTARATLVPMTALWSGW